MQRQWSPLARRLTLGTFLGSGAALFIALLTPDWSGMDASDVVALAAVVTSGIVGLGGLFVGQSTANRDREQAAALAQQDRRQARLEAAYVELLIFAEEVGAWAQALLPMIDGDPADPARGAPEPPGPKAEASMRAKIAAFGSPEVAAAMDVWRTSLHEIRAKVLLVQLRSRNPHGADYTTPWTELLDTAKPAEEQARTAIQKIVARELSDLKVH